jgi:hypothetical protein
MHHVSSRLSGVAAFALFSVLAFAQNNNGRISGTITDSTGSVVAGAKIAVTNQGTGIVSNATSSANGFYVHGSGGRQVRRFRRSARL